MVVLVVVWMCYESCVILGEMLVVMGGCIVCVFIVESLGVYYLLWIVE